VGNARFKTSQAASSWSPHKIVRAAAFAGERQKRGAPTSPPRKVDISPTTYRRTDVAPSQCIEWRPSDKISSGAAAEKKGADCHGSRLDIWANTNHTQRHQRLHPSSCGSPRDKNLELLLIQRAPRQVKTAQGCDIGARRQRMWRGHDKRSRAAAEGKKGARNGVKDAQLASVGVGLRVWRPVAPGAANRVDGPNEKWTCDSVAAAGLRA